MIKDNKNNNFYDLPVTLLNRIKRFILYDDYNEWYNKKINPINYEPYKISRSLVNFLVTEKYKMGNNRLASDIHYHVMTEINNNDEYGTEFGSEIEQDVVEKLVFKFYLLLKK